MFKFIKGIFVLAMTELKSWIHLNRASIWSYTVKALLGMLLYIVVSDTLTVLVTKIITGQTDEDISLRDLKKSEYNRLAFIILTLIKYTLLVGLLYEIIHHLHIIEIDPTVTMAISTCIILLLVVQGYLVKKIKRIIRLTVNVTKGKDIDLTSSHEIKIDALRKDSEACRTMRFTGSVLSKLGSFIIAIIIVYIANQGIAYVIDSKGTDITALLRYSESKIAAETKTNFIVDVNGSEKLPIGLGDHYTVKTDGDLNLIYVNRRLVGINTSSRKYKIYGVAINQGEVYAMKQMFYPHEDFIKITPNDYDVYSNSYLYYSRKKNDCFLLTVNNTSNRIASLTYFTDYRLIHDILQLED
ncbi:MAG: hypothetical protein K6C35_07985 [Eubacterium sp.]|nr:hypothetical protein [Eubacterium sp.]